MDKWKWYWMGKSPKAREAVIEYMRSLNTNHPMTQREIAERYGLNVQTIQSHVMALQARKMWPFPKWQGCRRRN